MTMTGCLPDRRSSCAISRIKSRDSAAGASGAGWDMAGNLTLPVRSVRRQKENAPACSDRWSRMVCAGSPALLCSRGVFQLKPRSLIRKMLPCFWKPGALTTAWPWLRRCSGVDNKSALVRHRAAQPCRLGDPALRTHEKSEYLKRNCVTARWGGKHREVSPIDRITSERDPASKVDEPASERLSHQRVRAPSAGQREEWPPAWWGIRRVGGGWWH